MKITKNKLRINLVLVMSNKYCFNFVLKVGTEGEFLISVDNLFQTKGP